jgi:hypothetical protein
MPPKRTPTRLVIDTCISIANKNNDDDDDDDNDTRWTRYLFCFDRSDCLYSARTEPINPYDCSRDW